MSRHVIGLMVTFAGFTLTSWCLMSSIDGNKLGSSAFCGLFAFSQMCMFIISYYRLTGEE